MPITAQKNSAFQPFAEYSQRNAAALAATATTRTTFPINLEAQSSTSNPAPVELIHSSDSLQALPFGFKPIKQMSSAVHCSTPSMSSSSSLSSPSRSNTSQQQNSSSSHHQPLRIPQPPRHSSSPSSSSIASTTITRFPPQHPQHQQQQHRQSMTSTIKPQIIGAGGGGKTSSTSSGAAAAAAVAALNATTTRSDLSSKTFNELVEIARRQQQQIDGNRIELEDRQKLIAAAKMQSGIIPSMEQLKILRQNISRDERELSQLSVAQRQAKVLSLQNDDRRSQLIGLQEAYSQDEQQLRHAVDKVDSLKKQIELLYRRRASAASAAIAQQRHINSHAGNNSSSSMNGPSPSSTPQTTPQKSMSQSSTQLPQSQQQFPIRPQASVVPFQIQKPTLNSSTDSEKLTFDQLDHPPASGKRLPQRNIVIKRPEKPPPPPKRNSTTVAQYGNGDIRMMHNGIERPMPPAYSSLTNNNSSSTDYYKNFDQGALIHGRTDQLSLRNDSMKSLKRRSLLSQGDAPEADIFRMLLEEQRKGKTHISFNDLHHEMPPPHPSQHQQHQQQPSIPTIQNTMNVNGVTVNLRSHVIQQQPRPIPPAMIIEESAAQTSQAAQMPIVASVKVSVSPQRSPIKEAVIVKDYSETSINTDPSIAELEKPVEREVEVVVKEQPKVVIEAVTAVDNDEPSSTVEVTVASKEDEEEASLKRELEQLSIRESSPESEYEEIVETLPLASELPQIPAIIEVEIEEPESNIVEDDEEEDFNVDLLQPEHHHHNHHVDQSESSSSSVDEEGSSSSSEIPIIMDESSLEEKARIKGILRAPGKKKHNKRIVFDPFVLFLDGALEGQLDTVQENASKIDDVSRPNDEGITALHNAICACHYEIVKFLVDAGADVNALDSDGWSPLHCAASCNNLPMLKLLIQNGASIYATTLSDSETPIRKCEEKESGYDQCINYLSMCDAWAGIINDRKMYAFYSYEAENDDELSFNEGEILTVISKDNQGEDRLWWLCESIETKKRGLVPANFLGIYPTLKHSQNITFKRFEIPSTPPPTDSINNNSRIKADEKILESSNFEKSLEISANA